MKKNNFFYLLLGASFAAFKSAEKLITDNLKPEFRYNVHLNMSNDDYSDNSIFNLYEEDNERFFTELTANEVVELLCRNDKIPVWIDISVFATNTNSTILQLICAGRYSSNESEFYYQENGSGVFGIKSPELPIDYKNGVRFSLKRV